MFHNLSAFSFKTGKWRFGAVYLATERVTTILCVHSFEPYMFLCCFCEEKVEEGWEQARETLQRNALGRINASVIVCHMAWGCEHEQFSTPQGTQSLLVRYSTRKKGEKEIWTKRGEKKGDMQEVERGRMSHARGCEEDIPLVMTRPTSARCLCACQLGYTVTLDLKKSALMMELKWRRSMKKRLRRCDKPASSNFPDSRIIWERLENYEF